jgi:hypothetical protein
MCCGGLKVAQKNELACVAAKHNRFPLYGGDIEYLITILVPIAVGK